MITEDNFLQHIKIIENELKSIKNDIVHENKDIFRTIINLSPNAVAIVQKGVYVYVNPSALLFFGSKNENEILNKPVLETIQPEYHHIINERIQSISQGKENKPIVIKLNRPDNQELYTETVSISIKYKGENAALIIGRDITKEYQIKRKLEENEKLLEETERLSKIGSYKINLSTGKATWSKGLFDIFNFTYDTELPDVESYYQYVHPDDVDSVKSMITDCVLNNTSFDLKYRITLPGNILKFVHSKSEVKILDDGNKYLVGFYRDITDKKKNDLLIEESGKKYKSLVEKAPVGVVQMSMDKIVFANTYFITMLGITSTDELIDKSMFDFVAKEDEKKLKIILKSSQLGKKNKNDSTTINLINKNNEFCTVNLVISEINTCPVRCWQIVAIDVTEKTKMHKKAKKLSTDAIYMSYKLKLFSQIESKLESIIDKNNLNKKMFIEMYDILKEERNLEQLWSVFQNNFEVVYEDFFKKLLHIAPTLTQLELKHCAFIKMNFETKEIATMFHVKPTSIQTSRVRLKKKLGLEAEKDLINFIITL